MSFRLRSGGIVFLIMTILLAGGCGAAGKVPAVKLDSGIVNEAYKGVAQPDVPKQMKLTEDERKNGIKKMPIKSKTGQDLIPETRVEDKPAQTPGQPGGGDIAKPQV